MSSESNLVTNQTIPTNAQLAGELLCSVLFEASNIAGESSESTADPTPRMLEYTLDAQEPTAVVRMQKAAHEHLSTLRADGKVDDETFQRLSAGLFSDFSSFIAALQLSVELVQATQPEAEPSQPEVAPTPAEATNQEADATGHLPEILSTYLGQKLANKTLVAELRKQRLLSPVMFVEVLSSLRDQADDTTLTQTRRIIGRFAKASRVNYAEPTTHETEMLNNAVLIDVAIGEFLDDGLKTPNMDLLDPAGLDQIAEIYNPNNLLWLAKELTTTGKPRAKLSDEDVMTIFRYHTVLRTIDSCYDLFAKQSRREIEDSSPRVGYRTWAGNIHEYGAFDGGRIDTEEWVTFRQDPDEHLSDVTKIIESGQGIIVVDGVEIQVEKIQGRIIGVD